MTGLSQHGLKRQGALVDIGFKDIQSGVQFWLQVRIP